MRSPGCGRSGARRNRGKLSGVGSPEELPKTTTVPVASTRAIAAAARRRRRLRGSARSGPAPGRCSVTISAAPSREMRARSGLPTTAVTRAPDRAASCIARLPDPAGGAGDQHPLAEQRRAVAQGCAAPSGRRPAATRRPRNETLSGNAAPCGGSARRRARPSRHCRSARRPGCRRVGPLPSAAACTTTPLMSWPGPPAFGPDLKQPQFAAVQRKGAHLDQRLVRRRLRLRRPRASRPAPAPFGVLTMASIVPSAQAPHPCGPSLPQAGEGMAAATPSPRLRGARRLARVRGLPLSTSVQPQIGDVLRVGLQFAALRPG